jgi:hypothetical protein
MDKRLIFALVLVFALASATWGAEKKSAKTGQVVWNINTITAVGGHTTEVLGAPKVISAPGGKAVEFDGVKDGLIVDSFPLAGVGSFTLEVVFCPYADGPAEQRFFHLQENEGNNRILLETRIIDGNKWSLDSFIQSNETNQTLLDKTITHPTGAWYNATLVFDGKEMRHYINGVKELSAEIKAFTPYIGGKTSVGMRMNKVFWFKGAIGKARFTPWALSPGEFLKP